MGKKWTPRLQEPPPARPYAAVIFDDPDIYAHVKKEMISSFGKSDYESEPFDTEGLQSAHGPIVRRTVRFISFQRPVGREELVDIRKKTLLIESRYQHEGRPLAELDPGYVSEFSVVRTALDEDFHRIYLFHGVHAETLYYFEKLSFRPMIHTPDYYRRRAILTVFNDLRLILMSG